MYTVDLYLRVRLACHVDGLSLSLLLIDISQITTKPIEILPRGPLRGGNISPPP